MDKPEESKIIKNRSIPIIGLSALTKLMFVTLHIPYLKDEYPVGIMIIAKPGSGKSMLLTRFRSDRMVILNDLTGYGFEQTIRDMEGLGKGYVVVPDFLRLMARKRGYDAFVTLANIVLEEGLQGIRRFDANVKFTNPLRFGIITAMTDACYKRHADAFTTTGFSSRFGVFSYSYEQSDCLRIEKMLSVGHDYQSVIFKIEPPKDPGDGDIAVDNTMAIMIRHLGRILAANTNVSFRQINFVRRLVKGHCLWRGRQGVTIEDIKEILALLPFFIPLNPAISTDLDYFIARGSRHNVLAKTYTDEEIYNATQRLIKKQIHFDSVVKT
jgi:hypothetical protein